MDVTFFMDQELAFLITNKIYNLHLFQFNYYFNQPVYHMSFYSFYLGNVNVVKIFKCYDFSWSRSYDYSI